MSVIRIPGGKPLRGHVSISGSKNSALAVLVAAALAEGECVLENVPFHSDVFTLCHILQEMGAYVWIDSQGRFHVDGRGISGCRPSYELVRKLRASFYVAG